MAIRTGWRNLGWLLLVGALLCLCSACTGLLRQSQIEMDMARTLAEIEKIYELNADTRKALDLRLKEFETRNQADSQLTRSTLADVEQRLGQIQETLDAIRGQLEEIRYQTAGESPDRVAIRVGQGDQASTVVLEGSQFLSNGQRALARREYGQAREEFQRFLEQFPNSQQVVEARMGIAETHYREEKWAEARAAFSLVEKNHVISARVPEALYKMAKCDEKTGRPEQAAALLNRLIAQYPQWPQIELAREMLGQLVKVQPQVPPPPAP